MRIFFYTVCVIIIRQAIDKGNKKHLLNITEITAVLRVDCTL